MLEVSDLCCLFAPFDERRCVVPCLQVQIESNILNHVLLWSFSELYNCCSNYHNIHSPDIRDQSESAI